MVSGGWPRKSEMAVVIIDVAGDEEPIVIQNDGPGGRTEGSPDRNLDLEVREIEYQEPPDIPIHLTN